MSSNRRYRCRSCGPRCHAWRPWAKAPNGVLLFGHLSLHHADQVGPYLRRIEAGEDIATVAAEAYEVVEGDEEEARSDGP
jgi:hypothetical protein